MEILDGNKIASEIKNEIAESVKRNLMLNKRPPQKEKIQMYSILNLLISSKN